MARRVFSLAAALGILLLGFPTVARAQQAPPPPPTPRAYVLVDGDTGAVIAERDSRVRFKPASTTKVITALVAAQHIPPDTNIVISPRAESMPARKINLKTGEHWKLDHLLYALLLSSANDAAVALAQAAGGTDEGFVRLAAQTARRIGMSDDPVLNDPAGLDDEFSFQGGNEVSPRDLAIATRALLAQPQLATIVATPDYRFTGGDGQPHHLTNHNRLLTTYAGTIGVKTGATKRAGRCLIAAATRGGRTMIAIVMRAADPYGSAVRLLDQGFLSPIDTQSGLDHLPEVPVLRKPGAGTGSLAAAKAVPTGAGDAGDPAWTDSALVRFPLRVVAALLALVVLLRTRVRIRRWRRRRRRSAVLAHPVYLRASREAAGRNQPDRDLLDVREPVSPR